MLCFSRRLGSNVAIQRHFVGGSYRELGLRKCNCNRLRAYGNTVKPLLIGPLIKRTPSFKRTLSHCHYLT